MELAYNIIMNNITTFTTIFAAASTLGLPLWIRSASNLHQCHSIVILGVFMFIYSILMSFVETSMEHQKS